MKPKASPITAPPDPHLQGPLGLCCRPGIHRPPTPRTFHTGLIRGDGGTLDSHTVLLGGQCGVNGDLVVSLVTVWEPQVKILELDVHVGQDELETDRQGEASARTTMTQGHIQAVGQCPGDPQPGRMRGGPWNEGQGSRSSWGQDNAGRRWGL